MFREHAFMEIAAVLGLATLLGAAGQKLRQPLIIMFLATGILAGPSGLGIISGYEQIELLAQMGIALLLFIVGLKLDVSLVRTTGPVALATGLGQILFTSAIGLGIALLMGMPLITAAYVAVALTFSSTIIIVKLLSDKGEIDSLHGQIAIGFLIVQDIAAILALVALTTFGAGLAEGASPVWTALGVVGKGVGMLVVVGLLMRYLLPRLVRRLSSVPELLTLFAIAWAVLLGAGGEMLGFSKEVGAFLAGVSLASTQYRETISSRLGSLRDFLLLFFFIDLGARLDWSSVGSQLGASALFSLFVLVGNPLIVMIIMGVMGYRRRTGFMAGLVVAQISEFSLIVAALGLSLGHITPETMGLVTLVGVTTIFASTYMILYADPLYRILSGPLRVFERRNPFREATAGSLRELPGVDVVLVGLDRYGSALAEYLQRRGKSLVGIDFDPTVLETWRNRGVPMFYGDMADPESVENLPLERAQWVASTVPSTDVNLGLLRMLRDRGYKGKIALTATRPETADLYRQAGAHVVFRPFLDAAEQAADALTHAMDILPTDVDWPIAFQEVRVHSGSAHAGKTLRDIPLRANTGVSILAVSRAGRAHHDPGPDFQIYPGDRLVLMGLPDELRQAEAFFSQHAPDTSDAPAAQFDLAEIPVGEESPMAGCTLAELQFRQRHAVTVAGIRRGSEQIVTPGPNERLKPGDHLIVIGTQEAVKGLLQT